MLLKLRVISNLKKYNGYFIKGAREKKKEMEKGMKDKKV